MQPVDVQVVLSSFPLPQLQADADQPQIGSMFGLVRNVPNQSERSALGDELVASFTGLASLSEAKLQQLDGFLKSLQSNEALTPLGKQQAGEAARAKLAKELDREWSRFIDELSAAIDATKAPASSPSLDLRDDAARIIGNLRSEMRADEIRRSLRAISEPAARLQAVLTGLSKGDRRAVWSAVADDPARSVDPILSDEFFRAAFDRFVAWSDPEQALRREALEILRGNASFNRSVALRQLGVDVRAAIVVASNVADHTADAAA